MDRGLEEAITILSMNQCDGKYSNKMFTINNLNREAVAIDVFR